MSYPVYHSVHDNFDWVSRFGDPDFTHHLATTLVWINAALLLTTQPLPPVDFRHFSDLGVGQWQEYEARYGEELDKQGISLSKKTPMK